MEPKVSVVIPVYNVERFLQTCIDSLVGQTLEQIELIFVNDASPDNSLEILKRNQEKYPNKIRVIDSNINLKQGGARNLGIRAARAPYIGFVDSDDFVSLEMYRKMYERICETEADVVFAQCTAVTESMGIASVENEHFIPFYEWKSQLLRWNNKELTDQGRKDLMCYPIGGVWSGLWRKSVFEDNDVFFPERLRYEDNYWGILIDCYLKKVTFINEIYYYYRQNSTSTIHGKNALYHLDRVVIENMLLAEMKKRDLFSRYKEAIEYIFIKRYAMNTFNILIEKFDIPPETELRKIKNQLNCEFPKWRRNRYFNALGYKEIIRAKLIMMLPVTWTIKLLKYKWDRK